MKFLTLCLIAVFALSGAALADMKSHDMHSDMHSDMQPADHGSHEMMTEGVHGDGELHALDDTKVNLSHGPIPAIGWPAMKMDLPLLEGAEIGDVKPGDTVLFMLEKGPDGMYGIKALMPKE